MSDKATAIHELEEGYRQFRTPLEPLADADFDEVWLGTWNLSQLLAHMAGWYREMAGAFGRVAAGERPAPAGVDYSEPDAWNARFAAQAKPGRAALGDFDDAYATYLNAANGLADDFYGVDPEKGRPRIGNRLLQASGTGHFEEHQGELEEWLKARHR